MTGTCTTEGRLVNSQLQGRQHALAGIRRMVAYAERIALPLPAVLLQVSEPDRAQRLSGATDSAARDGRRLTCQSTGWSARKAFSSLVSASC